jgi:glycine/D-amino acid oxidase-like deaminating enzyme
MVHVLCGFFSYRTKEGKVLDPEIYPRPRGEVYVCGMTEEVAVPDDPQQIIPRPEATAMLQRVAGSVSSVLADAEIEVAQACFLPCSEDGVPVIGKIPNVDGAYVATGHSCWGILNAPATGASLAELIVDGVSTTVDLKPFDPLRFCIGASRSR